MRGLRPRQSWAAAPRPPPGELRPLGPSLTRFLTGVKRDHCCILRKRERLFPAARRTSCKIYSNICHDNTPNPPTLHRSVCEIPIIPSKFSDCLVSRFSPDFRSPRNHDITNFLQIGFWISTCRLFGYSRFPKFRKFE